MSRVRLHADALKERAIKAGDATSVAIARRAGVEESTISRLLAGRTTPTVTTLVALRSAYSISLDDLVTTAAPEVEAASA